MFDLPHDVSVLEAMARIGIMALLIGCIRVENDVLPLSLIVS
jgi:hypothetical protein